MIEAVFVLQIIAVAAILLIVWRLTRYSYALNVRRVAESFAADLLKDWERDTVILNESGTKEYVGNKYLMLCAEYGLPQNATGDVVKLVWDFIEEQQKVVEALPTEPGFSFYS